MPALTQDLSGVSKQIGAPVKALLGVNLLRRLNATIDYSGWQFVVRSFSPPAPPDATRVDVAFIKGGGMVLRSSLGPDEVGAEAAAHRHVDDVPDRARQGRLEEGRLRGRWVSNT